MIQELTTLPSKPGRRRGASGSGAALAGSHHHPPSAAYPGRATTGIDTTQATAQIPLANSTTSLHQFATSRTGVAPRPLAGANTGSRAPYGGGASRPIPIGPPTSRTGPGSTAQYLLEGFTERELRDRNTRHRVPAHTAPAAPYRPSPPDAAMEELLERAEEQWRENRRRESEEAERAARGLRARADAQAAWELASRGRSTETRPVGATNRSRTPVYTIPRFHPAPPRPQPPPPPRQSSANRFTVGFDTGARPPARLPPPIPFAAYGISSSYRSGAPPRLPSPFGVRRGPSPTPRRGPSPSPLGAYGGTTRGPVRGDSPAFGHSYGLGQRASSRDAGGPQRSQTPRARGRDPYQAHGAARTSHTSPRATAQDWVDPDLENMTEAEYNAFMTREVSLSLEVANRSG